MSGTSKFDLTDHNERERKGTAAVMSSRKTEMRVRVSLSLKGQGGRGSRRHGKMLQILTKKTCFIFQSLEWISLFAAQEALYLALVAFQ